MSQQNVQTSNDNQNDMRKDLQRVQFVPGQIIDPGGKSPIKNRLSDAKNRNKQ